jgi:hypothetical protein
MDSSIDYKRRSFAAAEVLLFVSKLDSTNLQRAFGVIAD